MIFPLSLSLWNDGLGVNLKDRMGRVGLGPYWPEYATIALHPKGSESIAAAIGGCSRQN